MSTSKSTLEFFLDTLTLIPNVHAKAMFGEYGIYSGEIMFALVCDGTLFLKTTPETVQFFEDTETKAYPGSKNTAPANPEWLEDREKMAQIVEATIANLPPPKSKKKKL
ncbi:TfoX/Sxy family protein [Candidatus Gracilibacteria bacterium]|nr:TfoX/Sxy family protein [Candidatus Gracilibacteria bacterium]